MSMSGAPERRSAALGLALQALLVAAVLGGLFWVVQHALEVLRGRGVRSGFDFLAQSAGFEISEGWLDYDSGQPFWRAFLAGFINTVRRRTRWCAACARSMCRRCATCRCWCRC